MAKKRIGILTGGGDVPGLNSVIKTVTYRSSENGIEVVLWIKSQGRQDRRGMLVGHGVFFTFRTYLCADTLRDRNRLWSRLHLSC